MRAMLADMKGIEVLPDTLTIRGAFKKADRTAIDSFATEVKDF